MLSEKRKDKKPISLVKALFWSSAIGLFVGIGCPLAFCAGIWFFSSVTYYALDKGECARAFQQMKNEKYHFLLPNESNTVITPENVNQLVELYRLSIEYDIVQDPSEPFDPRLIWFLSNHDVVLLNRGAARIETETFALYQNIALYAEYNALRICSTGDGSQLDFLDHKDSIALYDTRYATNDRSHIFITSYVQAITNQEFLTFRDSNQENLLLKIPIIGYLYDTEFSDDKRTLCALTSAEFICWGVPNDE